MNDNEIYKVELTAPVAIVEKDSRRSDEVRQRLQQLDSTVTLNAFEQGDLWAEAKANGYYTDWKFESFFDYIKASGVDLCKREIHDRITISNVSKLLGVNKTLLAKAKISKLKLICSLDPNATVTESGTGAEEKMSEIMVGLIQDAPNKTIAEIKEIIKRLKGVPEEPESELTWMNLVVRRDAKQIVTKAIELAAALSGTTLDAVTKEVRDISSAVALERICADFTSDPNNQLDGFKDDEEPEDSEDEFEDSEESDDDSDVDEDEDED